MPISIIRLGSARPPGPCAMNSSASRAAGSDPHILFVGRMTDGRAGPHPIARYEVHFLEASLAGVTAAIEASACAALVHPLTDDDMADHTDLAHWIGAPVDLDLDVLDPPGRNQGVARFGKSDF